MNLQRRRVVFATAAAAALAAAGCSTSPPAHWYQLPVDPPEPAPPSPATGAPVWELSPRLQLPGALDRDALLQLQGSELQVMQGHRWAEPLRDALPRLLRHDLERLRGRGSVWLAPLPAGLVAQRQLRVEVLALQADPARSRLRLLARWWLADGRTAPFTSEADLAIDLAGASAEAIVAAHRRAVWQLARRIAASPV